MPPYYDLGGVGRGDSVSTVGGTAKSEDTQNAGAPNDEASSDTDSEGADAGTCDGAKSDDGGCQVVFGHTGSTTVWAMLTGLLSLLGLRRRGV